MRRTERSIFGCMLAALALAGPSCGGRDAAAPPVVRYGESVCADCGMIISDERFACAMIADTPSEREASLLFDDIGDMLRYEREHGDVHAVRRWVHDYSDKSWLPAEHALYVRSPAIRSPMASGIAAFATRAAAEKAATGAEAAVLGWEGLSAPVPASGERTNDR